MQNTETEVELHPFVYDFEIYARDEEEADNIMEAFAQFSDELKNEEIIATLDFIRAKPEAIPLIRKWIYNPPKWLDMISPYLPEWLKPKKD